MLANLSVVWGVLMRANEFIVEDDESVRKGAQKQLAQYEKQSAKAAKAMFAYLKKIVHQTRVAQKTAGESSKLDADKLLEIIVNFYLTNLRFTGF